MSDQKRTNPQDELPKDPTKRDINETIDQSNIGNDRKSGIGEGEALDRSKSVLDSLAMSLDCVPRVSLRDENQERNQPLTGQHAEESTKTIRVGRYEMSVEIARGGMGAILKARDTDLGRDLAIKVLLADHETRPEVISRFVEEAQIGGQLQHPGIAPVYELGQFPDQRPFFSMKLVQGDTLSTLLNAREDASEDRSRFLNIFEQICQTMAYAHDRGVIHRDLKPANIMVGAFGEVQVMDWGLAKVLASADGKDDADVRASLAEHDSIRTSRSEGAQTDDTSRTMMGSVMGTPAYMPPEQALGKTDRVDERADVFSLGAILCEILSGSPPYVGQTVTDIYQKASVGDLAECYERLEQSNADEELIDMVRRCLAQEPDQRFRNAGDLAKTTSSYRQSVQQRLHQAELDRIKANTEVVEERKRRRIAIALAASIVVLLCVVGGGWTWVQRTNAALARAESERQLDDYRRLQMEAKENARLRSQVNDALSVAAAWKAQHDPSQPSDTLSLTQARESARRAESLMATGHIDDELSRRVTQLSEELDIEVRNHQLVDALDAAFSRTLDQRAENPPRRGIAPTSAEQEGADRSDAINLYQEAFVAWGLKPGSELQEAVTQIKSQPERVQDWIVASLSSIRQLLEPSIDVLGNDDWTVVRPIAIESSAGSTFTVEDDGSIFVSGDLSDDDVYTVRFPIETKVGAIRLEFIPDPRLPKGGSGRGDSGNLLLGEFEVAVAGHNGESEQAITRAITRNRSNGPISNTLDGDRQTSWGLHPEITRHHALYYLLGESLKPGDGRQLQIRLVTARSEWPHHSPGRFRISTSARPSAKIEEWCKLVIQEVEADSWRQAMRREIAAADAEALIRRASGPEVHQQPRIVQLQLADALRRTAQNWGRAYSAVQWNTLEPTKMETSGGAKLTRKPDGSILASGELASAETYTIRAPLPLGRLDTIRLETIPDPNLPNKSAGRGTRRGQYTGNFLLRGFRARLVNADGSSRDIKFHRARSDAAANSGESIGNVIDHDSENVWNTFPYQFRRHFAIFSTEEINLDGMREIIIEVESGGDEYHSTLGRFRLSVSLAKVVDAQSHALALSERLRREHPDDYWTNAYLAGLLMEESPPRRNDAIRNAAVAAAMRPKSPDSHLLMVRMLAAESRDIDDPLSDLAVHHAARLLEMRPGSIPAKTLAVQLHNRGISAYRFDDYEEAGSWFEKSLAIFPTYIPSHLLRVLVCLDLGQTTDEAVASMAYLKQREFRHPDQLRMMAVFLAEFPDATLRDTEKALQYAEQAFEKEPDKGRIPLGLVHYRLENWPQAIDTLTKGKPQEKDAECYRAILLAMTYWQLGQEEDALKWIAKSDEWTNKNPDKEPDIHRLHAEARALMGLE